MEQENTNNNITDIKQYGFNEEQINAIITFVQWAHHINTRHDAKIEALQFYKSDTGNFYASYYYHGLWQGNYRSSIEYVEIDKAGKQTDLKTVYDAVTPIVQKFDKLQPIKL